MVFQTILEALEAAGLVSRQSRQRLDSTQMLGRVSKMNRLDCVRESLRLALQEVEAARPPETRPSFWGPLWERYVESQTDYRAGSETLARKLGEAGADAHRLLTWLAEQSEPLAQGEQARLLARVFGEQFELKAGPVAPPPERKEPVAGRSQDRPLSPSPATEGAGASEPSAPTPSVGAEALGAPACRGAQEQPDPVWPGAPEPNPAPEAPAVSAVVEPKGKGQFDSDRVQNPHDPEATYAVKGQGQQKKEHVGYKVQVAETVCEAILAPGEPTRNFIVGMVTHPAYQSDEVGAVLMAAEQAAMGLERPPVQYVDGAYISAQKLVEAQAQGLELIGPAQPAPQKDGRFTVEDFQIDVAARRATCPAGRPNTQCSRLEEGANGKVSYRFEFSTQCHDCPLRQRCLGPDQRHRTVVVGEHHGALSRLGQGQTAELLHRRGVQRQAVDPPGGLEAARRGVGGVGGGGRAGPGERPIKPRGGGAADHAAHPDAAGRLQRHRVRPPVRLRSRFSYYAPWTL